MQTARAAEGDKREIARIKAAFNGDDFDGALHRGVRHFQDAICGFQRRKPDIVTKFFEVRARCIGRELHSPA